MTEVPNKTIAGVVEYKEEIDVDYQPGQCITFGNYPQTSSGDDNTPIEWLVLARDGKKALLLSLYGLDAQYYHHSYPDYEITWEVCDLRRWLNGTFMDRAFSTQEQERILLTDVDNSRSQGYYEWNTDDGIDTQDKVFLLSYAESKRYLDVKYDICDDKFNPKAMTSSTEFAVTKGAWTRILLNPETGEKIKVVGGGWWLRSLGPVEPDAIGPERKYEYHIIDDEFNPKAMMSPTEYAAKANGASTYILLNSETGEKVAVGEWWLRSLGPDEPNSPERQYEQNAACVSRIGELSYRGIGFFPESLCYVRPALWINLESEQTSKAGLVTDRL